MFFSHTLLLVEAETINVDGRRAVYRHPFLAHAEFSSWRNSAEAPDIWSIWQHGREVWRGDFSDVCLFIETEFQGVAA